MKGQRHLVKCRCVLQQFKNAKDPPNHMFVVFSVIRDDDTVVEKIVQCNNCGIVHKIVDICKSKIVSGKEESRSILTIDDVRVSVPKNLADVLDRNKADLPTWEHAKFVLDNKQWGELVLLGSDEENESKHGKYVRILGDNLFKVDSFSREEIVTPEE